VQDGVERTFDENIVRHVMLDETEARMTGEMGDIIGIAGYQVVHGDDSVTFSKESVTQVRSEKTCAASDQYTHRHTTSSFFISGMVLSSGETPVIWTLLTVNKPLYMRLQRLTFNHPAADLNMPRARR
jgi:hypothetical protein